MYILWFPVLCFYELSGCMNMYGSVSVSVSFDFSWVIFYLFLSDSYCSYLSDSHLFLLYIILLYYSFTMAACSLMREKERK